MRSVVPAVRALLAKELVEKYNMKQNQVAEILGLSQSAVSKYTTETRGYVIKIEYVQEIQTPVEDMIALLINKKYERTDFLKLFCQACTIIRNKALMCKFCHKADPTVEIGECDLCLAHLNSRKKK